jgi:hypothetical protein
MRISYSLICFRGTFHLEQFNGCKDECQEVIGDFGCALRIYLTKKNTEGGERALNRFRFRGRSPPSARNTSHVERNKGSADVGTHGGSMGNIGGAEGK